MIKSDPLNASAMPCNAILWNRIVSFGHNEELGRRVLASASGSES